jgi:two-component system sensor kinase FixL
MQQDATEHKVKITGYLEKAVEQVNRAAAIITGLRNLVQRGETARAAEDVNQVVEEAVETAMIGIPANKIAVSRYFAPSLPQVPMNRIQIQQVVLNLVRNAAEAMQAQDSGKIAVRTRRIGDAVEVEVADTGPGVPVEFEPQLFKPFATSKESGMGIGLSISRSIVNAHGGALSAERNPVGGMTFRFTLPLTEDDGAGMAGA